MKNSSNFARRLFTGSVAAGAVAAAGWFAADPLVEWYIGDYEGDKPQVPSTEEPAVPEKPIPVKAKRGPIKVAIGFDVSKSKISGNLDAITAETRKFLENTSALSAGDQVSVCTFVEDADCESFKLPDQKDALISRVNNVQLDPRKPNDMDTYVHNSVSQILSQTEADLVLAWTDGQDEDPASKEALASGHAPIVIVVPSKEYVVDATNVSSTLGRQNVDVRLATTSAEFGKDLENLTGGLNAKAQREADLSAEQLYEERLRQHNQQMKEYGKRHEQYQKDKVSYQQALEKFNAGKEVVQDRIQEIKKRIKKGFKIAGAVVLSLAAASMALLIGINRHKKNKPKFPPIWFIVDKRGRFLDSSRGPSFSDQPYKLETITGEQITLVPTREGILIQGGSNNGKILRNGDEITPGFVFTTKDPEE